MKKRIITSKGDGMNYLGYAPDGSVHNMRESKGGFYKITYKKGLDGKLGAVVVGEAVPKNKFILSN